MDDGRMPFGRHRGLPLELVPVESLAWAAERLSNPPEAVLVELRRRAEQAETHDGLVAKAALSTQLFKRPRKRRLSQRAYWYAKAAAHGTGRRTRKRR